MRLTLSAIAFLPVVATAQNAPPANDLSNPLWSMSLEDLAATRERPLFSPTRRPPPPALPSADPALASVPAAAPPFSLVGTVSSGEEKIVVLFDKNAKAPVTLRLGATASGWTLAKVDGRTVVLRRDDVSATLALPAPGDPAPATPGRSPGGDPE